MADGAEVRDGSLAKSGVAGLVLAGAVWLTLSARLQVFGADTLVPVFASLYRWTPFYWGQNRLGMVIPLLASPVTDPIANLQTQTAISYSLGLLLPFLLSRWLLGPRRWLVGGALGATVLVAALRPFWLHFFLVEQCYAAAAAVALAGVLLLASCRPVRQLAGWLLLAIAFWINPATILWLAPMALLRTLAPPGEDLAVGRPDRRLGLQLAGLGVLSLAVAWAGRLVPGVIDTPLGLAPVRDWPPTWGGLASGTLAHLPAIWPLGLAALPIGFAIADSQRWAPEATTRARRLLLLLGVGAVAQLLGMGVFAWVALVKTAPTGWRYAIPTVLLALLAPPLVLAAYLPRDGLAIARLGVFRLRLGWSLLALPIVGLALAIGPPSRTRTLEAMAVDSRSGQHLDPLARELIDRQATHLLAPYWLAYPMAFRANSLLFAAGERRTVWPLAYRAESARDIWEPADWATARIAVLRSIAAPKGKARPVDFDLETERRKMSLPELERVESGDLVDIYSGRRVALPPG